MSLRTCWLVIKHRKDIKCFLQQQVCFQQTGMNTLFRAMQKEMLGTVLLPLVICESNPKMTEWILIWSTNLLPWKHTVKRNGAVVFSVLTILWYIALSHTHTHTHCSGSKHKDIQASFRWQHCLCKFLGDPLDVSTKLTTSVITSCQLQAFNYQH